MAVRRKGADNAKVKIGTILDRSIVDKLKERALHENKPISAIIEEAVLHMDNSSLLDRDVRMKALESFLSTRFNLATDDWNAILEEDCYKQ